MRRYLAELIGTFALVFCGTGAIIVNQETGGVVGHQGIAVTFGLIVLAMIHAIGDISGAHLNPAVTIGFTLSKRLPLKYLLPYVAAQLAGALLASSSLKLLFPANASLGATLPAATEGQAFVLEVILTFLLMFVIMGVSTGSKEKGITAGMAVAAVVGLEAMFAGPITGASMNPARSVAPALLLGQVQSLWLYLAAPVIGAAAGAGVYLAIAPRAEPEA